MVRQPSLKIIARNEELVKRIRRIKLEHPFWGYRRVWAWLYYHENRQVNLKRVYRLMKTHGLLVAKNQHLRATRTPQKSKPRATMPNQWWGIDMTKVLTESGWCYITIVLDWFSKKVVGVHIGTQSKAKHWYSAVDMGLNAHFPEGARGQGLSLMSDNGSQPTSRVFMAHCSLAGVEQAFTSYNNPKGNADTERFMRTMKEECLWLDDWQSPTELERRLTEWLEFYNTQYLHSTLGYKPPVQFENDYYATLLKSA